MDSSASSAVTRVVMVGSGASSSTPKLQCLLTGTGCRACADAKDPRSRNHRLNPSLLIQIARPPAVADRVDDDGPAETTKELDVRNVIIDCCKTFRESAIKVLHPLGVSSLHGVILTHDHADATLGLDDLREFSSNHDKKVTPVSVFCDEKTEKSMKRVFPYLFNVHKAQSYVASIDWKTFDSMKPFNVEGVPITPLPVEHGKNYCCYGFGIPTPAGSIIYLSDVSTLPERTLKFILSEQFQPINCLIVDMLGDAKTPVHFNFDQAIEATKAIAAPRTYFTGVSHKNEYYDVNSRLLKEFPDGSVQCGYDGLVVFDAAASNTATANSAPAQ